MNTTDTISAIATGVGGAIAVIRISGKEALTIGRRIWSGRQIPDSSCARRLLLGQLHAPDTLDMTGEKVLFVYMPGPASYTGEDVVEIQCHGGAAGAKRAFEYTLLAGARAADPGEFTFRAYLNGKMDLSQAEAVGEFIAAESQRALTMAGVRMSGRLGDKLRFWYTSVNSVLAETESRMDFPEEDLQWESPECLGSRLEVVAGECNKLALSANAAEVVRNGVMVVLAGCPNAGKSSLLNALLGRERAIVSATPGTTRDTLEETLLLKDILVRITDTAGLRQSSCELEQLGVERTRNALQMAQVIFWVLDASGDIHAGLEALQQAELPPERTIVIWNKMDLCSEETLPDKNNGYAAQVKLSARTGENLDHLVDAFAQLVWQSTGGEAPDLTVNGRQKSLLLRAEAVLLEAAGELKQENWELAGSLMREGVMLLGQITGENETPEVLEEIFSRFCIGK